MKGVGRNADGTQKVKGSNIYFTSFTESKYQKVRKQHTPDSAVILYNYKKTRLIEPD